MAAKILNLDELTSESKKVVIGGKEYPVVEMSVAMFIASQRRVQENKEAVKTEAENIQDTVDLVKQFIPSIETEVVDKISMAQLAKLVTFLSSAPEDVVESANNAQKAAEPVAEAGSAPAEAKSETPSGNE